MPKSKHRKDRPKAGKVIPIRAKPVSLPERTTPRSIYATMGFAARELSPYDCTSCGRSDESVTEFLGEPTCDRCLSLYLRTPFAESIVNQMIYLRRKTFDTRWNCVGHTYDGAAWEHPSKGIRVIEAVALAHQDFGEMEDASEILPVWPGQVEQTEFGPVTIARSVRGLEAFRVRGDATANGDARLDMMSHTWERAKDNGWQWWHHVVISVNDADSFGVVSYVKSQFVTDDREAYIRMPSLKGWAIEHSRGVHLWHSLHDVHGETGRALPAFDPFVSGLVRAPTAVP